MPMLAAIALGSNLPSIYGDPAATVREAARKLGTLGRVIAVSSLYVTTPVGFVDQPDFVNAAALLEAELAPLQLLGALLSLEKTFGRDRRAFPPKGPRTLDLDLLLYGGEVLLTPELTLPHPSMHERAFVLQPLAEIAPYLQHPTLRRTVGGLYALLAKEPIAT
jgi:2-amino-4-hydroxy-6-hydroxymethyldihydropteridine diphosphokinase